MSIKNLLINIIGKLPFGIRSRIKNIPGLKQVQSSLVNKWVNNESFVATISGGPAKGLVFPVHMPQDKLMWIGTWELDFATALQAAVKPGWICYDIGGYKGYYAGVMALQGAEAVHIFEPMPGNVTSIKKLVALNPDLPIVLEELAVSGSSGETSFKVMPEQTMGKLTESLFQAGEQELHQIEVKSISLDDFVANGNPEPDFIKIDVEGAEELVLNGGIKMLERKKPLLMIEVHSPEIGKNCLALLENIYSSIKVLETGKHPGAGTPQICHYIVSE
jgi:FkbM family methyltransferase